MTTLNKRADTIVHELDPYNAEPHTAALAQDHLTAINTFYSRNHGPIPDIGVAEWTTALTVPGDGGPVRVVVPGFSRRTSTRRQRDPGMEFPCRRWH